MERDSQSKSSGIWLRVAIACGALPLVVGVVTLIIFLQSEVSSSEMDGWVEAGVSILMGGVALFSIGLVTLGVYLVKGSRGGVPKRDLAQNAILTLILLLANFPAALACIWVAGDSLSRVGLSLVNESDAIVEDLNITWPGGDQYIGDLGSQDSAELSFHVSSDGTVDFTARQGGAPCEGNLIGYVTTNMGETMRVVFSGDCEVRVTER